MQKSPGERSREKIQPRTLNFKLLYLHLNQECNGCVFSFDSVPLLQFFIFCSRVKATYGEGFRCPKWTLGGTKVSHWSLVSHCPSPKLVRSCFCRERREPLRGCAGHCPQGPPCPEAGRHPLAQLLSLRCHPRLQTHLRSLHFSWWYLSLGLS